MTAGDIDKTHGVSVELVAIDGDEDWAKGEIINDIGGTGFEQADAGSNGPFMVALEARVYATDTAAGIAHTAKALFSGIVTVKKAAGAAIAQGRYVAVSATAGAVCQWDYTDPVDVYEIVGIANEDAASDATEVSIRLRC